MQYTIKNQINCNNYKIKIMENTTVFDENTLAEFICTTIRLRKFTEYNINDKDIVEVMIVNILNRINDSGFELNNGSEFECLTNDYLVNSLNHLQLTSHKLFEVDTGIDVISYNAVEKKLNLTEVKSAISKNGYKVEKFVDRIKDSLDSQLCKKRKTGSQAIRTIEVVKETIDEKDARVIVDVLKAINKDRAILNQSILLDQSRVTLNSFIWCTSFEDISIQDIVDFLGNNTGPCIFCGNNTCDSSSLLSNNNVEYNIYVNKINDKFDIKEYLRLLSEKLKVQYGI